MENKEIKRHRPHAHDCNRCSYCQKSIKENSNNFCSLCHFLFFEKLYRDFSSGNKLVDEIIKNPIYIPPKPNGNCVDNSNYYQWIPWECLSNINEIARGGFGIIYKATLIDGLIDEWSIKHNGSMEYKRRRPEEVAIKIMSTNRSDVFKELNIQRAMTIKGGNLGSISLNYGITHNAETLEYGIVMAFAEEGDMRKYLSKNFHSTSWEDKLGIASDIAEGLSQIHYSGMVHRDLHSGNILQYYENIVEIGDLGLCQPVNNEVTTTEEKKIYGVIPYIPPEVLRGETFTTAGDIYSFSMLLWELATGKPPFHNRSHDHFLIMDILNGQRPKITSPLIPSSIAEIIVKCWDVNPENRPTAWDVYKKLRKLWAMYLKYTKESKTLSPEIAQFLESYKCIKEMEKNGSETIITTSIHPGAVYTSRLLTAQMVDFSKELVYLPQDEFIKEMLKTDSTTNPLGRFSKYFRFLKKTKKRDEIANLATTTTKHSSRSSL
ncbi:hypothetical protein G9A89_009130 [Geosiphon pyriformis]|nr:hypothetical protein G9A89_009130 [Geosiphon pyriformis]